MGGRHKNFEDPVGFCVGVLSLAAFYAGFSMVQHAGQPLLLVTAASLAQ